MNEGIIANIFSNHMILQRDLPIKFWGKVGSGAPVVLTFNDETFHGIGDELGNWEITLPPLPAGGGPYDLTVESNESVVKIEDILMGDVWICSGQSNMEINMQRTRRMFGHMNETVVNPYIRKYHVPMNYQFDGPKTELPAAPWITVKPGETEKFSATGYFFANKIFETTGVPVGIILSALGGTPIESWMARELLTDNHDALATVDQCLRTDYMLTKTADGQKISDRWYKDVNTFDRGLTENWATVDYDDTNWNDIDLNTPWDEVYDLKEPGVVWLRKKITLTAEQVALGADVIFGTIIDADEVYVNGEKIGGIGYRYPPRDYVVPNFVSGENVIVIRLLAVHGMGGFTEGKKHCVLFSDGSELLLTKGWKYQRALTCPPLTGGAPMYQNTPTGNYNGMIAPLHPLGIKGVLWYQGESNAGKPDGYGEKLIRMASHWRQKWGQGDFPFLVAQLPNWSPKGNVIDWSRMREEQMKILTLPNTGVAVTYDSGESNDLHPLNKKAVGERLASEALRLVYGATDTPRSPYIKSILKSGNDLHLCFETDGSALKAKNAAVVAGLSVWYKDIQVPVTGEIHKNKMVIKNVLDGATDVSYAWCDDPRDANLYNLENLPAYPFKKQL